MVRDDPYPEGREIESFGIGAETRDFRALGVLYFRPFVRSAEIIKARLGMLAETWRQLSKDAGTVQR